MYKRQPQHQRKREMEKEKSDAALARIFDSPSFPLFSIGSTNASCAGAACVEQSSGVFRHEVSVNVCVFLHDFLYTILQKVHPYKNDKYLFADRFVRNRYQIVTCYWTWINCSCQTSTGIMRQSGAYLPSTFPPLGMVFDPPSTHDNN